MLRLRWKPSASTPTPRYHDLRPVDVLRRWLRDVRRDASDRVEASETHPTAADECDITILG